jgi:hypothetical protein
MPVGFCPAIHVIGRIEIIFRQPCVLIVGRKDVPAFIKGRYSLDPFLWDKVLNYFLHPRLGGYVPSLLPGLFIGNDATDAWFLFHTSTLLGSSGRTGGTDNIATKNGMRLL